MAGLGLIVIILIIWNILLVLITIFVFRKQILAFIYPSSWAEITMIESDNNISTWLEKKNPDLRFQFNKGLYNMFEIRQKNKESVKSFTSVYRSGRLAAFTYIEGNENPIDLRNLEITGNPQTNRQILKQDLTSLWIDDKVNLLDILQKAIPIILIIGLIIIISMLGKKPQETETVKNIVIGGVLCYRHVVRKS